MSLIGHSVGAPYPPYTSLTAEEMIALAAVLKESALAPRFAAAAAE